MRENVGHLDRTVRSVLGSVLAAVGAWQLRERPILGALGICVGALVLESAVTRVCPMNAVLGIDTRGDTERISDFRADINAQTDRIAAEYGAPSPFAGVPVS